MVSVLIVNWNTKELLRACLHSIRKNVDYAPLEVIVVDNHSPDGSAHMVADEFPEVVLIAHTSNSGYARGNNLAFQRAKGDWLLTLNPDTEFKDDAIARAVDVLRANPKVGALGGRLVGPEGDTQASVRGFPTFLGLLGDLTGLGSRFPSGPLGSYRLPAFDYERPGPAPQPMGTFLMFRREALAAVGDPKAPFDEQFPIFFNEVDLLLRLDQAGWPCWYDPSVRVVHHGGMSTKQVRKNMIWESHKSLLRFFKKHPSGPAMRAGMPLIATIVYAGAFARARGYHAGFRPEHHDM